MAGVYDVVKRIADHLASGIHALAQPPQTHGNAAHSSTFATTTDVSNHNNNDVHVQAQPPQTHGNTKHSSNYAVSGAITNADIAAGAGIAASKLESGIAKISTGSYTGNNTQNRAVAHGLGRTPKFVIAFAQGNNGYMFPVSGYHAWTWSDAKSVTGWDSTNFYIGQSGGFNGNESGLTYYFVAVG